MIPTKDYIDGLVRMLRIEAYGDPLDDYNPVEDYEDNGGYPLKRVVDFIKNND